MDKRFVRVILMLVLVIISVSGTFVITNAEASDVSDTGISVSALVDGMKISSMMVEDETYLFLPASADLKNFNLSFDDDNDWFLVTKNFPIKKIKVADSIDITTVTRIDNKFRRKVYAVADDGTEFDFFIMKGSHISTIHLSSDHKSENREWIDQSKNNKTTGHMKMIKADGSPVYDGELTQIKARGNSTFAYYDKKPYQIKLEEKSDLLDNGEKGKTWILLANYADATQMHDKLFKDLASEIGMDYVANTSWVNLYYDGEYRGLYLLSEKNGIGSSGIDITDMEEEYDSLNEYYGDNASIKEALNSYGHKYLYTDSLIEPSNKTGGYLIELERTEVTDASGFYTAKGVAFNVKSPEWAGKEAMNYISNYYQEFEDAVYATDSDGNYIGYNSQTGKYFYEYVDMESLVKMFMLQELSRNPDGFSSSLYFYKDADDIMYVGPIWDQDLTLGNGWGKYGNPNKIKWNYLAEALIKIPEFKEALIEFFEYSFVQEISNLIEEGGTIDQYYTLTAANAAMNSVLWPYVRMGDPAHEQHTWPEGTEYEDTIIDMKEWIEVRLDVLNNEYGISATENELMIDLDKETVNEAIKNNEPVALQIDSITAVKNTNRSVKIRVNTGVNEKVKVKIPISNLTYGIVAVAKDAEGEWNLVKATSYDSQGIIVAVNDGDELKILNLSKDFADISESDWEKNAVDYASARGILNGISETFFGPDGTATRGMICTVLARIAGYDTTPSDDEHWQQPGLNWAVNTGVSDGTNPDRPITRQQLATMLYRYMGEPENQGDLDSFEDREEVSSWAEEAMKWAAENEIFKGDGEGHLNPDNNATRAEIAQVMMNFMIKGAN